MSSSLSFTDAAEKVLREDSDGRPMHYTDIVRIAIEKEYLLTEGQTPERTLSAQIGTENRRRIARGEDPRFMVHGNGYYSLSTPSKGIEREIERQNERARNRLREALYEVDPEEFEYLIASLLAEIGYEDIEVTSHAGDWGIDINAILTVGGVTRVKTAVQVKRHKKNIGSPTVRELRGSLGVHHRGLIITTSDYTAGAYDEAVQPDRTPISLVNGEHLVNLLVEYGIGVRKKAVALIELDREALEGEPDLPELETEDGGGATAIEVKDPLLIKRSRSGDRVASIWPLPGGADKYADTLFRLLALVVRESPTHEDIAEWFLKEFPNVKSKKTTSGYLQVLRGMGLIRYDGEDILVTPMGAELASSQSIAGLRIVLETKILGIVEIEDLLKKEPYTANDIHQALLESLELGWTTNVQTYWRLAWLECIGVIGKKDDKYFLVSSDRAAILTT